MPSSVKPPSQKLSLDVLGQWHSIARGATAEQIAIAFRSRREVRQRHLLRHNCRVHFTSLADASSATMRAGVESARLELPKSIAEQILEWTRSRDGLRTIGALTVAMDVLFRLLEDMVDELPSQQTWEKIGPAFMTALRHLCNVKIKEIDRDHETRPPVQTMMVHVFTRARRFVQVPTHWRVTHREILAAMIKPAGMFIEMERAKKSGFGATDAWPRDDVGELDMRSAQSGASLTMATEPNAPDDTKTRPMGHQVLREPETTWPFEGVDLSDEADSLDMCCPPQPARPADMPTLREDDAPHPRATPRDED